MGTPWRQYSSIAVANTLNNAGGISNSAVSIFCATTPVGYPALFPFTLELEGDTTGGGNPANAELVSVISGSGTSGSPWIVQRGYDGTTAVIHGQGVKVQHVISGNDLAVAAAHEAADSTTTPLPHNLPASAWASGGFSIIAEQTMTNSTNSSVAFNNIPGTYANLLLAIMARSDYVTTELVNCACSVNGDSTASYAESNLYADDTSGTISGAKAADQSAKTSWSWFTQIGGSKSGSAVDPGGGFIIIPAYTSTAFGKLYCGMSGYGEGTTHQTAVRARWGWYVPAAQGAITSLTLTASNGHFITGSFFGLYGFGA
jgi:hypothetical protein